MAEGDSTPSGQFEWWRKSLAYRTGMGMSDEEKAAFEEEYRVRQSKNRTCATCEQDRSWMLQYSPLVRFMIDQLKRVGDGEVPEIKCLDCNDLKGGGFHPQEGILLCANWLKDKWQLEDVLTHELVHAYDYKVFAVDLNNLKHHACTEIRASMLSGECRVLNEIRKTGLANFSTKFQSCVRRRAVLSVTANPKCKDAAEAEAVVGHVWNSCFNDTRPFERVYR
ncbi:Mitochondrial inner membrane protease atp23 [Scheffersomyces spartinae]|uniref:Mitochondrial inner membrane protease ATP23 n=1 Tax=Scheffersomyces spartinae TaxID=45513 RepID=A0A9P7V8G4_9ASCO|nr:Mitochondrial inner membrane protease atp23 [Scheffersomyces spartinae]KAG7192786.1 Mitochondrial inner membrane protease atp23 [Scheffersomyces spartinae]